jgi:hypothetical protein
MHAVVFRLHLSVVSPVRRLLLERHMPKFLVAPKQFQRVVGKDIFALGCADRQLLDNSFGARE